MGMECYGVSLQSNKLPIRALAGEIEHRQFVVPKGRHSIYEGLQYLYDDQQHLIEMLLCEEGDGLCLSIRFALSNYSTIDSHFISLTKWAVDLLKPQIWPMNGSPDVRNEDVPFPHDGKFFTIVQSEIETIRGYWIQMFDPPRGPVKVKDAYVGLLPP